MPFFWFTMGNFFSGIGLVFGLFFLGVLTIGFMNGKKAFRMGIKWVWKQIPDEFKDLAKDFADKGFITTSSDNLINSRTGSYTGWCMLLLNDAVYAKISDLG